MVDGFKPGQRKILFCAFKRNLKSDIKVAQLVRRERKKRSFLRFFSFWFFFFLSSYENKKSQPLDLDFQKISNSSFQSQAGYVSEHSAYHHGETSLQSTIVGLAQV